MLIKSLLDIQARHGYLPDDELRFLALRANVPLYRIEEVTTFFPHFRRERPPRAILHVCQSMTCHLRGAADLLKEAQSQAGDVEVHGVPCLGRCDRAPVAVLGVNTPDDPACTFREHMLCEVGTRHPLPTVIADALAGKDIHGNHDLQPGVRPKWNIDIYHPDWGFKFEPYKAVKQFLKEDLDGDAVIQRIQDADLVGMGGAAARTAKKWADVRAARGKTRYVICNADESEPGTFKDRELLLHTPYLIVEGMLLAGLTLGASHGYIYIRHEYHEQIEACRAEIERARSEVPEALEACELEVFVSPGKYICGEESALIEVIEGKRAQPRNQPPDIRNNGLFDQPTLVNNVETYAWVPAILLKQPAGWYRTEPLRFFSLSGDVVRPGVYEVPFSCTIGQLIDRAGGMRPGLELQAMAPSGPSGGFLPAQLPAATIRKTLEAGVGGLAKRSKLQGERVQAFLSKWTSPTLSIRDLPLDVALFRTAELSLGAGMVVYGAPPGKPLKMLDHTLNLLQFFEAESCGKCVPCRLGCQQLVHFASILQQKDGVAPSPVVPDTVRELAQVMEITSICGLGRAASAPFMTWLEYFAPKTPPRAERTK